jgi:hypothetical protein
VRLRTAERTTEKLKKFWMPLDKYTQVTMEGLRQGAPIISTGGSLAWYEKFDKDKEEIVGQLLDARQKW